MRESSLLAPALAALALAGCGGSSEPAPKRAPEPFRTAITEYLRINSMDMAPQEFDSLQIEGDRATARVRMAPKDGLYGMKVVWTIAFEKAPSGWRVIKVDR